MYIIIIFASLSVWLETLDIHQMGKQCCWRTIKWDSNRTKDQSQQIRLDHVANGGTMGLAVRFWSHVK